MNLTRYTILVGNYGSGKTELSLALAQEMRRQEPESRIALVDLDIDMIEKDDEVKNNEIKVEKKES